MNQAIADNLSFGVIQFLQDHGAIFPTGHDLKVAAEGSMLFMWVTPSVRYLSWTIHGESPSKKQWEEILREARAFALEAITAPPPPPPVSDPIPHPDRS